MTVRFRALCFIVLLAAGALAHAAETDAHALKTDRGWLSVTPVHHASFYMHWNDRTILVDPVGPPERYAALKAPDLVLITHAHSDHLDTDTLAALDLDKATLVMPKSVAKKLDRRYGEARLIMANGEAAERAGLRIHALPMYNLPPSPDAYHPKGWGNGYVLTLGGKRVYISGDTEGTPEMRGLKNIDLAFVCMNLPYTMDVEQAADAVADFQPGIVYPYHYRGQDTQKFKRLVDNRAPDVQVRLRDWYPE